MANYSFKTGNDLPNVPADKTFRKCNFYQAKPNTEIFAGVTGLIFEDCMLINCKLPADSVTLRSNHVQWDLCTNLRPNLIDYGVIPCETECAHMISKDEITIDGVVIDTIYEYANERL